MKRVYSRVSDDEFLDIKRAALDRGVTIEYAIRKGLEIYLYNEPQTQTKKETSNERTEHRAEEDQETVQGNRR